VRRMPSLAPIAVLGLAFFFVGSAASSTFKVIHSFCADKDCRDGALPNTGLAMDNSGTLYGATDIGGHKNHGVLFVLTPDGNENWDYMVRWKLCRVEQCGKNATRNVPALISDGSGNVYGVRALHKRQYEAFELTADGVYSSLYRFKHGEIPSGPLAYAGALQGQPYDGHSPLYGTITHSAFSLTPSGSTWLLHTLYHFCRLENCQDGDDAIVPPIVESTGDLVGVTAHGGGSNSAGVIYRLTPDGGKWTETVLHEFCQVGGCTDGGTGASPLSEDSAGNLYGTTVSGGSFQQGVAYELSQFGQFNVLYSFCSKSFCADGASPYAVTLDAAGNLYGTTANGGTGFGVLYQISGQTETVVHTFCSEANCADGEVPVSQLLKDSNGNLFGTTRGGGANPSLEGTVFELTP